MRTFLIVFFSILTTIAISLMVFFTLTPAGKKIIIDWQYSLNKVDEQDYERKKEVESTCRSMIASYNNDKQIYLQYKDSDKDFEIELSNNAKTRANTTATTYNNYIIKNSFVWKNNVPSDIYMALEIIK